MSKPVSDMLDLLETIYESSNPSRRWQHCSRRDWVIEALNRLVPTKVDRALEIGAGAGVFLPTLSKLADQVTVVDIDVDCVSRLGERVGAYENISLILDDITQTKLEPGAFDVILCSQVIEHIPDSLMAVRNMHRLLKDDGVLVIGTPQKWSPKEVVSKIVFGTGLSRLAQYVYGESLADPGHINLQTKSQMMAQLNEAGFEIQESHFSGLYLPLISDFGGNAALSLAKFLEPKLRSSPLAWLLSTQSYVATKQ